jgi:hypothetical protein
MRSRAVIGSDAPGYRMANPGESSIYRDAAGQLLMRTNALLEGIDRRLAPSP